MIFAAVFNIVSLEFRKLNQHLKTKVPIALTKKKKIVGTIKDHILPVYREVAHSANNYADLLAQYKISFVRKGYLLERGEIRPGFDWIIHISVIQQEMQQLMEQILPFLIETKSAFTLPVDKRIHAMLLDGSLGYEKTGKIISIYPVDKEQANGILKAFSEMLMSFKGPRIPDAYFLCNCIYAEFRISRVDKIKKRAFEGIWPFSGYSPYKSAKTSILLNKKYIITEYLKKDIKGDVFKCIYFRSVFNPVFCVIKEGNMHQCTDDQLRNIGDRLKWQYKVQQDLSGYVPLPGAIEYFEENENSYFAMEYIEGVSFSDKINELHRDQLWQFMALDDQVEMISYLVQITGIVMSFHSSGYIHRDLNPANFIVSKTGKIWAIDIELSYKAHQKNPEPAYALGSPGYMSANQLKLNQPSRDDDIYGLGGLLLKAYTGLSPTKFDTNDAAQFCRKLEYFIGDYRISTVICLCLCEQEESRPDLATVRHQLELHSAILLSGQSGTTSFPAPDRETVNRLAIKSVLTLWTNIMSGASKAWLSKCIIENEVENENKDRGWKPGFFSGAAGILFVIAISEKTGLRIMTDDEIISKNLDALINFYECNNKEIDPGLTSGYCGFGICLFALTEIGYLQPGIQNIDKIYRLINQDNTELNLSRGIAGQGLTMLYLYEWPQFPSFYSSLKSAGRLLIDKQRRDGSWIIKRFVGDTSGAKLAGFSNGTAGILFFLLELYARFKSPDVKTAAEKALAWLRGILFKTDSFRPRPESIGMHFPDFWLDSGLAGIALVYIKAFEVLQDACYKEAAKNILSFFPRNISSNYLSLGYGLSGLGEVYLEAYRVFREEEWKIRADHIINFLIHCSKSDRCGNIYWLDSNETIAVPDLMKGQAGIIHFLLRYLYPEKVNFPF